MSKVRCRMGFAMASVGAVVLSGIVYTAPATAQEEREPATVNGVLPPPWAFTVNPPGGRGAPPDEGPYTLPGTDRSYTWTEIRNGFDVADWRPDTHPPLSPAIVNGREPDVRGCGFCHYPNGQGRPENGPVAGLPAAYIIQQLADFKAGLRMSSEPRMGPPRAMLNLAKAANDDEIREAAEYFSSFAFKPWVRVVESATVPVTTISGGMHVPVEGGGTEPIGQRIVEVAEDPARTAIRDPASGFVAYVPPGSVARGEELVTTGSRTAACGVCHGEDLRGLGPVPPVAGRSPSYVVRQLFDFQSGARRGAWSALMTGVVEGLTIDDLIAIAAYTASRTP